MPTLHNPAIGNLCTCPACTIARLDRAKAHREDMSRRQINSYYLDGDYDLIGTQRRYQTGE